jgi:glycosyltransferase involved in cell wall biosynthesis
VTGSPDVSVLMPARNAASTIGRSIDSVLRQTLPDWELIVVDDGSSDDTGAIAGRYAKADPRIRVVEGPAEGEPAARNAGLDLARGRYIAMLDADDLAIADRLERQTRFMDDDPGLSATASVAVLFVREGVPMGRSAVTGPSSRTELERLTRDGTLLVLCHPTLMWRTAAIHGLHGYDPRFVQACDAELVNRAVYRHGMTIVVIQEPFVWYRISAGAMSSRGLAAQRRYLRYLELRNHAWIDGGPTPDLAAFLDERGDLRRRWRWWRHDTGAIHYRRGGILLGEGSPGRAALHLGTAAVMHPRYVFAKAWQQRVSPRARRACIAPPALPRREP